MDNKKPLILVPPMSEPMKKLKEVLVGIATEENIDIFSVEDQKEFGQLIGSGGQALVIISNAKLCATLLQEYRALIAKNHTKVILLTPKEIPAKTLVKFTKIGLTESILENSPPKTLLYKVKLLLRSIKVVQKEDNNQQLIKSMLDLGPKTKIADEIINEKSSDSDTLNTDQNSSDEKKKFKNEDEAGLDYLSNLTGKKKMAEDVIETHWKSKKDKNVDIELGESKEEKEKDAINDIDMYYRGRQKNQDTEIEIDREDLYGKKKDGPEEEDGNNLALKRKNETINEIEAAKKERSTKAIDEEEIPSMTQEKIEETKLNIEKNKKHNADENDNDEDINDLQNKLLKELELEKEKNKTSSDEEEQSSHYKGKIKNTSELNIDAEEENNENQSSEIEVDKQRASKQVTEENIDENEQTSDNITELNFEKDDKKVETENEVIDKYLRGKIDNSKSLDLDIETPEIEQKKETNIELESEDPNHQEDQEYESGEENKKRQMNAVDSELEDGDLKQEKLLSEEASENHRQKQMIKAPDVEDLEQKDNETEENQSKEHRQEKMMKLDDDNEFNDARKNEKNTEDELNRKAALSKGLDLEDGDKNKTHEGKTEHISTYYKTGENKSKEQDWNLPQNKKDTIIELSKTKAADINLEVLKKSNSGEITIDYRKLKEEFELISRGELNENGESSGFGTSSLQNQTDSEDQYKVYDINPGGFEFAIEVINLLYSPDLKNLDIYRIIAEQLMKEHKAYLVTYQYNLKDKNYNETFNTYNDFAKDVVDEIKSEFNEIKDSKENMALFASFSMPTYLCRSIPDNGSFWRDIELPQWANKELTDKKVELVYPFFDGVDRMGYAHIYFPNGINPSNDKNIQITIEMLRTVFLESIQRSNNTSELTEEKSEVKSNVLNMFTGLFGKKKAG